MRSVFGVMVVTACAVLTGCSGSDEGGSSSGTTSGGTTSGGTTSGGTTSGGTTSGGTTSGGTTSGGTTSGGTTSGGTTTEKKEFGAQCKESADCKSDFCIFRTGGSIGMCTQTCDDDIDCPGLGNTCVKVADAPQKVCVPK
jgi:hypothetical protein